MWSAATVIVITLGLTEIWQRKSDGCVAVTLPLQPAVARGEYTFRNSTTAENLANLRAIIEQLRGFSSAPIVVTVSPVPLHATFRDTDIIVANCESKSRLRAVVADLLEEREELHYFHSYELVSHWQGPETFFLEDGRHVSPDGVAFIMNEFLRMYGAPGLRPPFVPFGQIDKPDQTAARRFKNLRSRVAKRVRDIKE